MVLEDGTASLSSISKESQSIHQKRRRKSRLEIGSGIALALNNAGRALPYGFCAYVGIGGHAGVLTQQLIAAKFIF
jgi:hypothetical protein